MHCFFFFHFCYSLYIKINTYQEQSYENKKLILGGLKGFCATFYL